MVSFGYSTLSNGISAQECRVVDLGLGSKSSDRGRTVRTDTGHSESGRHGLDVSGRTPRAATPILRFQLELAANGVMPAGTVSDCYPPVAHAGVGCTEAMSHVLAHRIENQSSGKHSVACERNVQS